MFLHVGALGAVCKVTSSKNFDTSKWVEVKDSVESPYYDATCKCWTQGYKPMQWSLQGILAGKTPAYTDPSYQSGAAFNVCVPETAPTCPVCKTCPTCPTCPPPKACPTCPTCPACNAPVQNTPGGALDDDSMNKYGVTLGILLAVAIVGGGGYYAYKKGAFSKGKRRR